MASLVPVLPLDRPTTPPLPWIRMDTTSKPLLVALGKPKSVDPEGRRELPLVVRRPFVRWGVALLLDAGVHHAELRAQCVQRALLLEDDLAQLRQLAFDLGVAGLELDEAGFGVHDGRTLAWERRRTKRLSVPAERQPADHGR